MAKKRNVKFIIDVFASRVSLLLLGALTAWLGYSVVKEAYGKHQVQGEIEALKQEILDLENRNNNLSSLMDSFEDPQNVELEAKRRLNLKKPGEEVAVILRDKNDEEGNIVKDSGYGILGDNLGGEMPASTAAGPVRSDNRDLPNPLKWWQYITGSK